MLTFSNGDECIFTDTALDNTAAVGKLREAISLSLQDCILALNAHTNNATPRMAQLLLILPLLRYNDRLLLLFVIFFLSFHYEILLRNFPF